MEEHASIHQRGRQEAAAAPCRASARRCWNRCPARGWVGRVHVRSRFVRSRLSSLTRPIISPRWTAHAAPRRPGYHHQGCTNAGGAAAGRRRSQPRAWGPRHARRRHGPFCSVYSRRNGGCVERSAAPADAVGVRGTQVGDVQRSDALCLRVREVSDGAVLLPS